MNRPRPLVAAFALTMSLMACVSESARRTRVVSRFAE
jgi:hypothetical protein